MKAWLPLVALVSVACSSSGTWRRVDTANFVLRTDLGSSDAKRAGVALETTRDALVSAAWPTANLAGEKTEVYVLANGLDFERYFGRLTGGLFLHTSPAQFFLYGSADRWELRRSAHFPTRSVLRHEMAHLLSSQVWPRQPRWLAEGLANFLEPVYFSEDETNIVVGGVNFDAYHEYKAVRTTRVEDALAWKGGGLAGMAQREAAGLYGISWLLFHWFFNRHPEELVKYIETLQAGTPPEDAFRVALPKIDLGTVDKEIYEYQRHGQFEEIPRPLVRSATSESTLQDRPLDSSEIAQVKQALAEASKRNQVPPHGERSESSDTEGEGHSEAKVPPRPHVDYGKLPLLPQYPCDEQSKEKMPGQPAAEAVASPGADTRQAMRAGARPAKKTSEEAKAAPKAGKLAPEIVQRVIRAAYGRMRACYENGLERSPNLGGRVTVRFVIDTDGSVRDAAPICTSLADPAAVSCVVERYGQLKFPKPSGDGIVTVVYPIMFTPGD